MTKVGDTIYMFDENRRVYRRDATGRAQGGPIFVEHFAPFEITGETPQSWIAGYGDKGRINKKTMRSAGRGGYFGHQWYTEQGKADRVWIAEHRHEIERAIGSATIDQLRRIHEILGFVA